MCGAENVNFMIVKGYDIVCIADGTERKMNLNFELIIFYAVVISGIIALYDIIFFSAKEEKKSIKKITHDYRICAFIFSDATSCFFSTFVCL